MKRLIPFAFVVALIVAGLYWYQPPDTKPADAVRDLTDSATKAAETVKARTTDWKEKAGEFADKTRDAAATLTEQATNLAADAKSALATATNLTTRATSVVEEVRQRSEAVREKSAEAAQELRARAADVLHSLTNSAPAQAEPPPAQP
jgi:methyl-accepting chemotaxis protein